MSNGYSGTPLAKKLGLKLGMVIYVSRTPRPYADFFEQMPENIVTRARLARDGLDFIHTFQTSLSELADDLPVLKRALKKAGILWISWPKGISKIKTDIKREPLRTLVLKSGLVDVKVCAVDADWSGLKFIYRLRACHQSGLR